MQTGCCVPLARCVQCCVAYSGRGVGVDETRKLRNTDSFTHMPTLDFGGTGVRNISLFVFRLLCDIVVCRFIDVAKFIPSTVGFLFFVASCCTFRFVELARIVFALCLFAFFAGVCHCRPLRA